MIRRIAATALTTALLLGAGATAVQAAPLHVTLPVVTQDDDVTAGRGYPGDPVEEARLVAAEERRIIDIETSIASASLAGSAPTRPFRMTTTGVPTVVLVARVKPYTLEEIARIAPRSVAAQDGGYLISEHLYVSDGATLRIAGDGLRVRLLSAPEGFATIVANGGDLQIEGGASAPVEITSWDGDGPDLVTADGRAYIREHAGYARLLNVDLADLGFWSGITGGLSLTGTVIPEPLLADDVESAAAPLTEEEVEGIEGAEALGGDEPLETLSLDSGLEAEGYASALIQSVNVTGDAFGLFVTNSDRVDITNSSFAANLVDGVVFHRDVTNTTVTGSSAVGNAQDGFNLTRASSGLVFERLTARSNGRNGITIEGRSLVDGPSATGIATTVYGDNEVRNSVSTDNGRYGIEVIGGRDISVIGNEVARNEMGIVVDNGATGVIVRGNDVDASTSQGIALRDAGLDAVVTDNRIDGAEIGIFARDAGGSFEDNTIAGVTNHGIALVGVTGASTIVGNTITGSGPTPIDVHRTDGTAVRDNDTADWRSTKPISVVLRAVFQPLTILWILIGLALLGSAIFARRLRSPRDPFADHAPLTTFTRGVVSRDEVGRPTDPIVEARAEDRDRELVGSGVS